MGKDKKNGLMVHGIKEIGETDTLTDKGYLIMLMETLMKVILFKIKQMDLESMCIKMDKNILAFGNRIYNMELEEKN